MSTAPRAQAARRPNAFCAAWALLLVVGTSVPCYYLFIGLSHATLRQGVCCLSGSGRTSKVQKNSNDQNIAGVRSHAYLIGTGRADPCKLRERHNLQGDLITYKITGKFLPGKLIAAIERGEHKTLYVNSARQQRLVQGEFELLKRLCRKHGVQGPMKAGV
mmetsp:Transcript_101726/g.196822  ORF Transcript_101726/g.196822 Transcript_101726/m.196822 type:complete len:161 (-) Transcript_101726:238-720(-)